jgi:hypothetical protein
MEHLVTGVLREFYVDLINSETKNLDTGANQSLSQLASLLRGPATANVTHQQSRRIRLVLGAPPHPIVQFPDGHRDPPHICLHQIRVDPTQSCR